MRRRSFAQSVATLLIAAMAGTAVRFAPLGLPRFVVKYGGSMFWAATIYWAISTLFAEWPIPRVTLGSGLIATAVEFFKLYRSPGMDAFRLTLPGVLLLGRYFSVWDIVAYWVAIGAAALVDANLPSGTRPQVEES